MRTHPIRAMAAAAGPDVLKAILREREPFPEWTTLANHFLNQAFPESSVIDPKQESKDLALFIDGLQAVQDTFSPWYSTKTLEARRQALQHYLIAVRLGLRENPSITSSDKSDDLRALDIQQGILRSNMLFYQGHAELSKFTIMSKRWEPNNCMIHWKKTLRFKLSKAPSIFHEAEFSPFWSWKDITCEPPSEERSKNYSRWAVQEADRVCHLYSEGVHPLTIYNGTRLRRFQLAVEAAGFPFSPSDDIFGAWRRMDSLHQCDPDKFHPRDGELLKLYEQMGETAQRDGIFNDKVWSLPVSVRGIHATEIRFNPKEEFVRVHSWAQGAKLTGAAMNRLAKVRYSAKKFQRMKILEEAVVLGHAMPLERGSDACLRSFIPGILKALNQDPDRPFPTGFAFYAWAEPNIEKAAETVYRSMYSS